MFPPFFPPNNQEKHVLKDVLGLSKDGLDSLESALFIFHEQKKRICLYYTGMSEPLKRITTIYKVGIPLFSFISPVKNVTFYPGSIPFLTPFFQNYLTTDNYHFAFGSHLSAKNISTYHLSSPSPYIAVFYDKKPIGIGKIISKNDSIIRVTNEISLFSLIKTEKQIRNTRFLP